MAEVCNYIASVLDSLDRIEEAREYYERAIAIATELHGPERGLLAIRGGHGGRPAPCILRALPLMPPQPDNSHPLLIALACDSMEVTHRQPSCLTVGLSTGPSISTSSPTAEILARC